MAFDNLNKEELENVVEFFAKDVEQADDDKGPTKKELVAALASGDPDAENEGDRPVSWDDYKNVYLVAKESDQVKVETAAVELTDLTEPEPEEVEEEDDSTKVLVKCERKNPRYDAFGFTFTPAHPFHSVLPETADYLVKNVEGFRLATPSEVADFYN